jgi:zinc protease
MASATYERLKLRNGLRVVLAPDRSAPVVAVAVYYDVGIRSEPQGRTGFAHLFEHLMFQGSASLGKMELVNQISASGGVLNGSTRLDYTNYYEMLPSNALDRALFLEADRMGWPAVTEENLANQIAVVKEEIRVNVLNEPYGGFPWLTLAPVLYETWANGHDGYGSFEDLGNANLDDARDFFDAYYAPGNAVLAVAGDFEVDQAADLVHRHFDAVPKRAVPPRPDFDEPWPASERRGEQKDDMAPAPAVALGWRVPDPADLDAYLPYVVLASALATGDASRLRRRLVQEDRVATDIGAHLGLMEDAYDVRNPCPFVIEAHHPAEVATDRVVAAVDEELDRLATDGIAGDELTRVTARLHYGLLASSDNLLRRTLSIASYEQQRGRAELTHEMPDLLEQVTTDQVAAAAAALRPHVRGRLDLVAGAPA